MRSLVLHKYIFDANNSKSKLQLPGKYIFMLDGYTLRTNQSPAAIWRECVCTATPHSVD
jgi:hypothetical protein